MRSSSVRSTPARLVLAAGLGCLVGLVPLTAAADTKTPLELSITVDDGQTDARPGAELSYAITVTNLGATTVKGLQVTHTALAGATFGAADPKATVKGQDARWRIDVRPGKAVTLHSGAVVAKQTPDDLLRFATVACATPPGAKQPSVCASDSDQLPAGAVAEQQRAELRPSAGTTSPPVWWYVAGGAGLLAAAAGAVLVIRARRPA